MTVSTFVTTVEAELDEQVRTLRVEMKALTDKIYDLFQNVDELSSNVSALDQRNGKTIQRLH